MKLRTALVTAAAAGSVMLGAAGVALADGASTAPPTTAPGPASPSTPTTPTTPKGCATSGVRLRIAADLDQAAHLRLGLLQQALAQAQAHGNQQRAQKLGDRIAVVTRRTQTLEGRMQHLEQTCGVAAPSPASSSALPSAAPPADAVPSSAV